MVHCRQLHLQSSRGTPVKLYVATEESFPIPLKYIDVSRTTDTLEVMLEKSIDDYWNVEPDALTTVVDPSDLLLRANRFSPLSAEIDDEPLPPIEVLAFRRRLTLVGVTRQNQDGESDTDSLEITRTPAGDQVGSQDEYVAPAALVARDVAVDELMVTRATHDAFASLVGVDLKTIFSNRACIMNSPPRFLRGAYRAAMRFALEEVESGVDAQNEQRICQGWKLFLFLPRMLLHKPARGGLVPKRKLMERFAAFTRGEWTELLITSRDCAEAAAQGRKATSTHLPWRFG